MNSPTKWKIATASEIGTAHQQLGLPCQDAFAKAFAINNSDLTEVLILAVSDGAGSAELSADGARLACESFVAEAKKFLEEVGLEKFTRDFALYWLEHYKNLLRQHTSELSSKVSAANETKVETISIDSGFAASAFVQPDGQIFVSCVSGETRKPKNLTLRDFACTFLAAVVGASESVFLQVGDGAIVFTQSDSPEDFLFGVTPEDSDYANITHFLTDNDAEKHLFFQRIEAEVVEVAIFTDGIQNLAIDFRNLAPHKPFFTPMFAPLRTTNEADSLNDKLESFLQSATVNQRTDDDKTLVLASRRTS